MRPTILAALEKEGATYPLPHPSLWYSRNLKGIKEAGQEVLEGPSLSGVTQPVQ